MNTITKIRIPELISDWSITLTPLAANSTHPESQPEAATGFPVKINETKSAISFEVQLADLNCVDTQVYKHRGELTIEITRQNGTDQSHVTRYCREFQLPASVQNASAAISLNKNRLCIKMPKRLISH
ncbi:MAG: Hsp20/alpha crystallin family protein [Chloroflexota bacterium]|nr:Hsp20/alpha crystallin family protein [Chloroflexota bacterium]